MARSDPADERGEMLPGRGLCLREREGMVVLSSMGFFYSWVYAARTCLRCGYTVGCEGCDGTQGQTVVLSQAVLQEIPKVVQPDPQLIHCNADAQATQHPQPLRHRLQTRIVDRVPQLLSISIRKDVLGRLGMPMKGTGGRGQQKSVFGMDKC